MNGLVRYCPDHECSTFSTNDSVAGVSGPMDRSISPRKNFVKGEEKAISPNLTAFQTNAIKSLKINKNVRLFFCARPGFVTRVRKYLKSQRAIVQRKKSVTCD